MFKYQLTVGLNDQETKKQEIATEEAKERIINILLNDFEIFAFTMFECSGNYKHDTGEIVNEKSIRIEIATYKREKRIKEITRKLCEEFNQESIMIERSINLISFIKHS